MRMKAEDGKLCATITLRDVVERNDVSDMPFLSEIKRLYDENDKLRELVAEAHACKDNDGCCEDCYADEGECLIKRGMRELGIEVEE